MKQEEMNSKQLLDNDLIVSMLRRSRKEKNETSKTRKTSKKRKNSKRNKKSRKNK